MEYAAPAVFEVDGAGDGAAKDAAVPEAFHAEEAQGGEPVVVVVSVDGSIHRVYGVRIHIASHHTEMSFK